MVIHIIDGRQLADEVLSELQKEISGRQLPLGLAAVVVGDVEGVKKFVETKKKAAEKIGVQFSSYELANNANMEEVGSLIQSLADDTAIDGILVELPLPKHLDTQTILDFVPVEKDVDVLSSEAQKKFYNVSLRGQMQTGTRTDADFGILPPAVEAAKIILEHYFVSNHADKIKTPPESIANLKNLKNSTWSPHHGRGVVTIRDFLNGKTASVFGQGILVGKPVAHWLEQYGATVHRIDSQTLNPRPLSLTSDIIVSGVGKPGLITGDMVKEGAVVIDFGFKDGLGDVDFDSVSAKASLITPTPGGTGPLVVAAVLKNLVWVTIEA